MTVSHFSSSLFLLLLLLAFLCSLVIQGLRERSFPRALPSLVESSVGDGDKLERRHLYSDAVTFRQVCYVIPRFIETSAIA